MFIGPFKKRKIIKLAQNARCDYYGDMIIVQGILYYVELCSNYIKAVRVASAEDYQIYMFHSRRARRCKL